MLFDRILTASLTAQVVDFALSQVHSRMQPAASLRMAAEASLLTPTEGSYPTHLLCFKRMVWARRKKKGMEEGGKELDSNFQTSSAVYAGCILEYCHFE